MTFGDDDDGAVYVRFSPCSVHMTCLSREGFLLFLRIRFFFFFFMSYVFMIYQVSTVVFMFQTRIKNNLCIHLKHKDHSHNHGVHVVLAQLFAEGWAHGGQSLQVLLQDLFAQVAQHLRSVSLKVEFHPAPMSLLCHTVVFKACLWIRKKETSHILKLWSFGWLKNDLIYFKTWYWRMNYTNSFVPK